MRASRLLLATLLCLGTAEFAFAQQATDDMVAGPPESAPPSEANQLPDASAPPPDQVAPPGDASTLPEAQIEPGGQQPEGEVPPPSDDVPPSDLGQPTGPGEELPPDAAEPASPQDAAQPLPILPSEQEQLPADNLAPPTQLQPESELAQPAPDGPQPTAEGAQAGDTTQTNPNPLSALQIESLSATRSLPLFTPSRTPPVVAPPEPEAVAAVPTEPEPQVESPPPPLQLIGIVLTDADQTALLRNTATGETLRLASGENFEDWTIKIVDARSIVFQSGDRVQDMKMFETFGPPNPPSGVPSGEPFDPGLPQDPNNPPPDDSSSEGQEPPPDNGQSDIVIPHHSNGHQGGPHPSSPPRSRRPVGNTAQEPDPDPQVLADPNSMPEERPQLDSFAPRPGNEPVPQEGALPDTNQGDATVSQ